MDRDCRHTSVPAESANERAPNEDRNGWHDMRDESLIQRIRRGETDLFHDLIHPYLRTTFALVRSVVNDHADAEDTVQEALLHAFLNLHQLRSDHFFPAWLFQTSINVARMLQRRNASRLSFNSVDEVATADLEPLRLVRPPGWHDSPSNRLEREEWQALLKRALEDLLCKRREVFVLHETKELSRQEAAEILGVTASVVKVRLHQACLQLRASLGRRLVICAPRGDRGESL